MYSKKTKNKSMSKKYLILLSIVLVLCIILGYFLISKNSNNIATESNGVNEINYNPPTEEEKQAGDIKKEEIVEEENNQSPALPNTAEVIIVDASQYDNQIEVRAFVQNVIENGTCNITFTQNSTVIEKSVPAYADATTTPCITLNVPRSDFPSSGSWNVVVTYRNEKIMGSAQVIMELQ